MAKYSFSIHDDDDHEHRYSFDNEGDYLQERFQWLCRHFGTKTVVKVLPESEVWLRIEFSHSGDDMSEAVDDLSSQIRGNFSPERCEVKDAGESSDGLTEWYVFRNLKGVLP